MKALWGEFAKKQLRRSDLDFGRKLTLVKRVISHADSILGAQLVGLLLDQAVLTKPSKKELYHLCEASDSSVVIAEYLRGYFMCSCGNGCCDRIEMAERLEQVLAYRLDEGEHGSVEVRLHQTVSAYLLCHQN